MSIILGKKNTLAKKKATPTGYKELRLQGVHKNQHTTRGRLELMGIAALSGGTWLSRKLDFDECARLLSRKDSASASKPAFLVISSSKGTLARSGLSDSARTFININGKTLSPGVLPDAKAEILSPTGFREYLRQKGVALTVRFKKTKLTESRIVSGVGLLPKKGYYGFVCPLERNRLGEPVDFETRSNKHNAGKVASVEKSGGPLPTF